MLLTCLAAGTLWPFESTILVLMGDVTDLLDKCSAAIRSRKFVSPRFNAGCPAWAYAPAIALWRNRPRSHRTSTLV
jgi:hypothetical protein